MRDNIKVALLVLVIVLQFFYFRSVVAMRCLRQAAAGSGVARGDRAAPEVFPGQVWSYKCSLAFHEDDAPSLRPVLAVRGGIVQYDAGSGLKWSCPVDIFLAGSVLVTNADGSQVVTQKPKGEKSK